MAFNSEENLDRAIEAINFILDEYDKLYVDGHGIDFSKFQKEGNIKVEIFIKTIENDDL